MKKMNISLSTLTNSSALIPSIGICIKKIYSYDELVLLTLCGEESFIEGRAVLSRQSLVYSLNLLIKELWNYNSSRSSFAMAPSRLFEFENSILLLTDLFFMKLADFCLFTTRFNGYMAINSIPKHFWTLSWRRSLSFAEQISGLVSIW